MGKTKVIGKSAIRARHNIRGSILNLWHMVFFVSGVVAMGLFHLVLISIDHSRSALRADRAVKSAPRANAQPWGELEITPMLLDRPEAKELCRVQTLLMKLKVTPQSDLQTLLDYWGGCGNADRVKPLLESVIRVREGAELNVSFFMPPVPRLNLYTYPNPASQAGQDCVFSAFNFFLDQPDNRFTDPEYANNVLQSDFEPVRGEKKFGDLLLLQQGDRAVHMCVYIAADIVYTKNGGHPCQPWILMKLGDLMVQYESDKPQQLRVFRKKPVSSPSGKT